MLLLPSGRPELLVGRFNRWPVICVLWDEMFEMANEKEPKIPNLIPRKRDTFAGNFVLRKHQTVLGCISPCFFPEQSAWCVDLPQRSTFFFLKKINFCKRTPLVCAKQAGETATGCRINYRPKMKCVSVSFLVSWGSKAGEKWKRSSKLITTSL